MQSIRYFTRTRGQARFARRPLVVRLGDSRIRLGLGDSGGDILTLSKTFCLRNRYFERRKTLHYHKITHGNHF